MNKAAKTCAFQCKLNTELKYLKFEVENKQHMVTLTDLKGYKIINGYGSSPADALNDLHHNLL